MEEARLDFFKKSKQKDIVVCYCIQEFKEFTLDIKDLTFDSGTSYPCQEVLERYTVTRGAVYVMAIFISLLSWSMKKLIEKLSHTEGHHTVTARLISATKKDWVIQFVNTGLLLLLINSIFPIGTILGKL